MFSRILKAGLLVGAGAGTSAAYLKRDQLFGQKQSINAEESQKLKKGIVIMKGDGDISGQFNLEELKNGNTLITGTMKGMTGGKHGIHIHEFGDLSNGCFTAGAHYSPTPSDHGGPNDKVRHTGDLGNLECDANGICKFSIEDSWVKLSGANSVYGRALVIHAGEDDLGKGNHTDSKTTGHSGARVSCGVIGVANNQ